MRFVPRCLQLQTEILKLITNNVCDNQNRKKFSRQHRMKTMLRVKLTEQ